MGARTVRVLRQTVAVGAKDLRERWRDRAALVLGLVAPVALALLAVVSVGRVSKTFDARIVMADLDGGVVGGVLREEVLADHRLREVVTFETTESRDDAAGRVRDGASAAIVIPQGFGAAVQAGRPTQVEVMTNPDHPVAGALAQAIADALANQLSAAQHAVRTALAVSGAAVPDSDLVLRAAALRLPISLHDAVTGDEADDDLAAYFGPSMAIIILLMVVQTGARSLMIERSGGTLARMLATGVRPSAVIGGKLVASFMLGMASITASLTAVAVFTGTRWHNLLAVVLLSTATVVALLGVAGLVTLLARTEGQANGYGLMATISLAIVGGNFIPPSQAPDVLRRLAVLTPNGWSLRGFADLAVGSPGLGLIVPNVLALLALAAVTGVPALLLANRMVHR